MIPAFADHARSSSLSNDGKVGRVCLGLRKAHLAPRPRSTPSGEPGPSHHQFATGTETVLRVVTRLGPNSHAQFVVLDGVS